MGVENHSLGRRFEEERLGKELEALASSVVQQELEGHETVYVLSRSSLAGLVRH